MKLFRSLVISKRLGLTSCVRYSTSQPDESPCFPLLRTAVKQNNFGLAMVLMGEEDPYEVKRKKTPIATSKSKPVLVPSDNQTRMIGCVCEPVADAINWIELNKGPPIQCYCGHWFQLVSYEDYCLRLTNSK